MSLRRDQFRYRERLGSKHIRLLRLKPWNEYDIRCTIEVVRLASAPDYVALSYTWGDPDSEWDIRIPEDIRRSYRATHKVLVNGREFTISTNLLYALLRLRQKGLPLRGRPIWIDAICINQNDKNEKNAQVNLMQTIYRRASEVIVWLGRPNQHTERIARTIKRVTATIPNGSGEWTPYVGKLSPPDLFQQYGISDCVSLDEWYEIGLFFNKTWFKRVWTMQEAALACHIIVQCGNLIIRWTDLCRFTEFINMTGIDLKIGHLIRGRSRGLINYNEGIGNDILSTHIIFEMCQGNMDDFEDFAMLWTGSRQITAASLLLDLLDLSLARQSSDPRDKIFATLGPVNHCLQLRNSPLCPIRADYTISPAELSRQVSRYILASTGSLSLLSRVSDSSTSCLLGLPSQPMTVGAFRKALIDCGIQSGSAYRKPFNASLSRFSTQPGFTFQADCLNAWGLRLGTVAQCGKGNACGLIYSMQLISTCDDGYWAGEEPSVVLCKTFTVDRMLRSLTDWGKTAAAFRSRLLEHMFIALGTVKNNAEADSLIDDWSRWGFVARSGNSETAPGIYDLQEYFHLPRKEQDCRLVELEAASQEYHNSIMESLSGRFLFSTREGDIGMGPESMQLGDEMWILSRGFTPFVLRKVGGKQDKRYRLVGEAYVHGVMYGEAVKNMRADWQKVIII